MPLLCISLLALLLLPQSLSCDSKRPPDEIKDEYMAIVQTDLDNTREHITALLQNSSCTKIRKPRNCTLNITNVVGNLHSLTCKMRKLDLFHTKRLVSSLLASVRCTCPEKPWSIKIKFDDSETDSYSNANQSLLRASGLTRLAQTQEPHAKRRNRRRRRRNETKENDTKKLCRASLFLSTMTDCYEMLNSLLMQP